LIYLVTDQLTAFNTEEYKVLNSEQFIKDFNLTGEIGVDTETQGFDPFKKKILTLQLGNFDTQYVIDVNCINQKVNEFIAKVFKSTDSTFLFQNAKFDLRFLMLKNWWPKNVYDTYLVESILYHGLKWEDYPKSLEHLAMKYCNAKLNKDIRGNIHYLGLTTEVIKYAADDVKYLSLIKEAQMIKVNEDRLNNTVLIENEFVKCLSYIEMCGMQIDPVAWKTRMEHDKEQLVKSLDTLNNFILDNPSTFYKYIHNQLDLFSEGLKVSINWNSPTQVVNFFKDLGLNLLTKDKKTGKMKYSVDAKVLTPQANINPVVNIYLDYKSQEKLLGTYGQNWLDSINPSTGRIHTQFKQMLDTARLSSGGKDKKNRVEYINFLNIPQDNSIRNCIVPKSGYVFIDSDYSSQEQVVLANFSKEPKLLEFYEKNLEGGDMHTFICKKLWPELEPLPVEEIKTKHKDKRHMAKIAGFSIN
jgi:DNA polymerase I-like protein with 3'-5' exonuclease and polymerase domains